MMPSAAVLARVRALEEEIRAHCDLALVKLTAALRIDGFDERDISSLRLFAEQKHAAILSTVRALFSETPDRPF